MVSIIEADINEANNCESIIIKPGFIEGGSVIETDINGHANMRVGVI
jgi:hypothetical protein